MKYLPAEECLFFKFININPTVMISTGHTVTMTRTVALTPDVGGVFGFTLEFPVNASI